MLRLRTPSTVSSLAALAALLFALVAGVVTTSHGADAAEAPRFATVARQTLPLAADALVWQLTESDAFADPAAAVPFAPGFLYAPDAALAVFRDGSDRATPVRPDRAFAIHDATPLAPTAADSATPTVFLALEILAEADAVTPAGDPFDVIQADYGLQLLRATLPAPDDGAQSNAEPLSVDDGSYPVLLVVVAGEIDLTVDEADPEALATGAALAVAGRFALTQSGEVDAVVLAVTLRKSGAQAGASAGATSGSGGTTGGSTPSGPRPNGPPSSSASPSPSASPSASPSPSPPAPHPCPGDPERTICPSPDPSPAGSGGDAVVHADDPLPCVTCLPDTLDPNSPPSSRLDFDPDDDGLDNDAEALYGSFTDVWDSDGDALGDGAEVANFGTSPTSADTDHDALTDWDEIYTTYTDPLNADSDGDGLFDGAEYNSFRTDPSVRDTDGDCLNDGFEVQSLGTNPHLQDTDGDGVFDSSEYGKSDPLNPADAYDGRGWQCAE